jgi:hypothetical protein
MALDCGFSSSATFARAFRAAFGTSASDWRSSGGKNRKSLRKERKDQGPGDAYGGAEYAATDRGAHDDTWRIAMELLEAQISACVTVPAGTPAEGEVGTMEIPGGRYAQARCELDPKDYGAAWFSRSQLSVRRRTRRWVKLTVAFAASDLVLTAGGSAIEPGRSVASPG